MVIQPNTVRGLEALVPQPPRTPAADPNPATVVIQATLNGNGGTQYRINEDAVELADLGARLKSIFETRNERIMFVKGSTDLDFGSILPVIDCGHAAGVENIGIITPAVEHGT